MDKDAMFDLVTQHRLALCDQVQDLSTEQWEAASRCEGWRVRDVLAHLVTVQDIATWRFVIGVVSISGFDRRVDRFALEYGARDPDQLIARYRELASNRVTPPFVGPIAPLADVMVHSLDIGEPTPQRSRSGSHRLTGDEQPLDVALLRTPRTPRSMNTNGQSNRNDVPAGIQLQRRNDVPAAPNLSDRNDVLTVTTERCPGGSHLAWASTAHHRCPSTPGSPSGG